LAPWRRETVDLDLDKAGGLLGFPGRKAMEKHLAGLRGKPAIYHCVSRVVDRNRILGPEEREKFVHYMRVQEEFCMVRVLTHAVMSNHFHILVEIPEAPEDRGRSWSDEKFLAHVSRRYRGREYRAIAARLGMLREQRRDAEAEALRDGFFVRMWDLSEFMKTLKQRFAQWYNSRNKRDGYLWSDRFHSVLIESGHAARTVAAYIDLNPVRAGIVEDPGDYRWCGYGEAAAGVRRAREGLRLIVFDYMAAHLGGNLGAKTASSWRNAASRYRATMFLDGKESPRDGQKGRAGIPTWKVAGVLEKCGMAGEAEMLRSRTPGFTRGKALGSGGFVEEISAFWLGRLPACRDTPQPGGIDNPLRVLSGSKNAPVAG